MKRININENNSLFQFFNKKKQPHFIGSWNIENEKLCKSIIDFFEKNESMQQSGSTSFGQNKEAKKTTDIKIQPNKFSEPQYSCFNEYIKNLYKCFTDYNNQWPFVKKIIQDVDIGSFNIQKYLPGDHFSQVHTERSSLNTLHRVFAWMTYLNDVEDGGITNFEHFDIKVKPKTGKTLIWPAEWTHAHSGEILNKGTKYIVTGWMNLSYKE